MQQKSCVLMLHFNRGSGEQHLRRTFIPWQNPFKQIENEGIQSPLDSFLLHYGDPSSLIDRVTR
jgi:hypothetical protein